MLLMEDKWLTLLERTRKLSEEHRTKFLKFENEKSELEKELKEGRLLHFCPQEVKNAAGIYICTGYFPEEIRIYNIEDQLCENRRFYKIGYTRNIKTRLQGLISDFKGITKIQLLHFIEYSVEIEEQITNNKIHWRNSKKTDFQTLNEKERLINLESKLHRDFSSKKVSGIHSSKNNGDEWFALDDNDLKYLKSL
ncbi:GIY-YIG nuclease family protein [Aquibacillus sediminis]|uniref:GIY-YIG nuclease family protein n=1 Tax=Aquibacillus sediminis TaxID=2574734 RepID=UPI0011098D3A|nr:GIY-YIG nuclease family protein [Aquibacillus sediminis]